MSRFQNEVTKVVVSVADSKDGRFGAEWLPYTGESADKPATKAPASAKPAVRKPRAARKPTKAAAKPPAEKAEPVADLAADDTK